jgi:hypothetical protein
VPPPRLTPTGKPFVTLQQLAEHLDMSDSTSVGDMIRAGKLPAPDNIKSPAKYDLDLYRQQYIRLLRRSIMTRRDPHLPDDEQDTGPPKAATPLDRQRNAAAEKAELELAKAKGELVPFRAVIRAAHEIIKRARSRLLGLPDKLAPEVVACRNTPVAKAMLERELRQALAELTIMDDPDALEEAVRDHC